ncbi:MAG TPA: DUF5698 domain-containing protein [Anaerolineales bacterium]|nr:DUF5698 domain-containing protein [Anaerolineales bacterium]
MLDFLISALTIFVLRIVDVSLYTVRIMMVMRGRKALAFLFAFFQALGFVVAMQLVFSDLGNWGKIAGYSAGFATGLIIGMALENRLAVGYAHLRMISAHKGPALIDELRQAGFAVTEIPGTGMEGAVSLLNCTIRRRHLPQVTQIVMDVDPEAFITSQAVRSTWRGFWRS